MPDPNKYYPGNVIRFTNTMVGSVDNMINPTSVYAALFYTTVTSIDASSIINASCRFFYFDFEVLTPGILGYRWETNGSHRSQSFGALEVTSIPWS